MRISILCSNNDHPVYPRLHAWIEKWQSLHEIELVERCVALSEEGGDILFLISCHEIIPSHIRSRYRFSLVVHASDLPNGRGWSPLVWQILEGRDTITVTLLDASDDVDTGDIWKKIQIKFEGHELFTEIYEILIDVELKLMDYALKNLDSVIPIPQEGIASYYKKRTPEDSRLDVHRSLAEQFDLLRTTDNVRYPAFFEYRGHRYHLIVKKSN